MKTRRALPTIALLVGLLTAITASPAYSETDSWPWSDEIDGGSHQQLPEGASQIPVSDGGYGYLLCGNDAAVGLMCYLDLVIPDDVISTDFIVAQSDLVSALSAQGRTDTEALPSQSSIDYGRASVDASKNVTFLDPKVNGGGSLDGDSGSYINVSFRVVEAPRPVILPPTVAAPFSTTVEVGTLLEVKASDLLVGPSWVQWDRRDPTTLIPGDPSLVEAEVLFLPLLEDAIRLGTDGFQWTPTEAGTYTFTYRVRISDSVPMYGESSNLSEGITGTITVVGTDVPEVPEVSEPEPESALTPPTRISTGAEFPVLIVAIGSLIGLLGLGLIGSSFRRAERA